MKRRTFIVAAGAAGLVSAVPAIAKPTGRRIILPDITRCEHADRTVRENTITVRYHYMSRMNIEANIWEVAPTDSDTYRRWLREDGPFDIPPHICFGGAVVSSPIGDPEFYPRWQAYARTLS